MTCESLKRDYIPGHNCYYFWPLIFQFDVKTILQLSRHGQVNIRDEFSMTYGGQAVGVGSCFLFLCHLLPAYLITNATIAAGYEKDRSKWNTRIIGYMEGDCDFFTCPYTIRPYIKPESYLVKPEETKELLKKLFHYFYIYYLLCVESKYEESKKSLCDDILYSLNRAFKIDYRNLRESLFSHLKDWNDSLVKYYMDTLRFI